MGSRQPSLIQEALLQHSPGCRFQLERYSHYHRQNYTHLSRLVRAQHSLHAFQNEGCSPCWRAYLRPDRAIACTPRCCRCCDAARSNGAFRRFRMATFLGQDVPRLEHMVHCGRGQRARQGEGDVRVVGLVGQGPKGIRRRAANR